MSLRARCLATVLSLLCACAPPPKDQPPVPGAGARRIAKDVYFIPGRFVAGELESESFAGIAQAMGAEAIIVDRIEDVGPALQKAIDLQMNQKKTCVIEIMCTRELGDPFRRDALSKPVRFLDKYRDYV